ncbi:Mn transporter [Halobacteriovorax marinus]|uniref:Natural resistance-associated macrophage membrane protein n=1 Tax=Halobacteriovorax marinus (strain ATCC BAA-682 / DSM 15412 / SJ) TaxID=862908 RepID=E1WXL6_HALMS|nr:Nramp family divalent metal transporter [Halobacteriovorax marinus]ATH08832.1 Mn transporter [Halobacteriovorax marinus]CBW27534.1 putative natural resistance-associated macrophage membrane protein [Halobacteriovorax marinus SJ]
MSDKVEKKGSPSFYTKLLILLSIVGPGIITANIDNDAGGIATYSLVGAKTGFKLLWTLMPITVALIMVQEMSARMGIASGKGLADLIREKFGLKVTFYSLFLLIFADLGNTMAEFAGIASAGEIFGISKYISVPLCSLFVWLLITKGNYKTVERIFIAGCAVYLSYIVSGFIIGPDWGEVAKATFIPDFDVLTSENMPLIVGLVGTSITPWMQFYIQSAVVEKGISTKHLWHSKLDVIVGCLFMVMVTIFIIICCAVTIHSAGVQINTAADAARALEPLAGKYSSILFGIGLFNASIFSAALLPLATSYYVCEGMGWESGVDKTFKEAPNFFTIFTLLILIAAAMILIPGIDLFNILIWTQVINGVLIPIILLFIINLCNDPDVMGEYTNSTAYNFISYGIVLLMLIINGALIYYEAVQRFF